MRIVRELIGITVASEVADGICKGNGLRDMGSILGVSDIERERTGRAQ